MASTMLASTTTTNTVTIQETPNTAVQVIPFAVRLPTSVLQQLSSSTDKDANTTTIVNPQLAALLMDTGVVGTITILSGAVLVWFGWGKLQMGNHDYNNTGGKGK